ncbi:SDR family oxidoreductase [Chitinophagaceae bacterium LB-8]|uniref:SDR family oxidoreductase n=1 Tax=Paraflavisolibacter caeni TaxID=2982496 RepID=A0A9X2XUA7_9BACT|nr:SDR family oxidoreductase [Paraflavisolibacter caeni]MCU7549015.1 SDR family oxidoreductase [Paraflavisolibacter caeni]
MNLSLERKNALICGSSQGIGFAIAQELALLGANCILLARNTGALEHAVQKLSTDFNQEHSYAVADFSKQEEVQVAIAQIVKQKPVHILVNNTGGPAAGPIMDAQEEDFLNAFQQHLICNHILTKAVVPGMKEEGYGRIINVISTSVKTPLQNLGVSNTIRAAVASWAKTMANELGMFNITVNNVLPGLTKTARLESLVQNTAQKRQVSTVAVEEAMKNEIPLKRFGQPSEIAAMAAFLASPAASFVSGTSIPVDGGRTGSI